MADIHKILLPIDFKDQSLLALDYTLAYAKHIDAEIHLLHVVEEAGIISKMFRTEEEVIRINKEIEKLLDDLSKKFGEDYKVKTAIRYGKPYLEIEKYADSIKPLFILMGKTEDPSIKKRIAGSNTIHIIDETKFPVITIRGKADYSDLSENNPILLPLDFTKPINEQLTATIEFAKKLKTWIKIITVDKTDSIALETKILTNLNKTKQFIEEKGIKCETKIIEDKKTPIFEIINKYAAKHKAMLVTIMTRDESNLREFFVGTTARGIINNCDIPVLSVRPWDIESQDSIFKVVYDPLNIF